MLVATQLYTIYQLEKQAMFIFCFGLGALGGGVSFVLFSTMI